MNSKDLWDKLKDMETLEIKVQATMMIMYLIKDREIDLNDFIKDLKYVYKKRGV
jgi:hypothetical protein